MGYMILRHFLRFEIDMTIVRSSRAMTIIEQANGPVCSSVRTAADYVVYVSKNDKQRKYSSDFPKQLIV